MYYYKKNTKIRIIFSMQQDDDWVRNDSNFYEDLFYQNYLHLVKLGNEKFEKSVKTILFKMTANIQRKLYHTIKAKTSAKSTLFPSTLF